MWWWWTQPVHSPETWLVLEGCSMSWRRCQSSHNPLAFIAALSSRFKFTSPKIRPKKKTNQKKDTHCEQQLNFLWPVWKGEPVQYLWRSWSWRRGGRAGQCQAGRSCFCGEVAPVELWIFHAGRRLPGCEEPVRAAGKGLKKAAGVEA